MPAAQVAKGLRRSALAFDSSHLQRRRTHKPALSAAVVNGALPMQFHSDHKISERYDLETWTDRSPFNHSYTSSTINSPHRTGHGAFDALLYRTVPGNPGHRARGRAPPRGSPRREHWEVEEEF